jgi:apolipoprotein N-acyltransferase
MSTAEYVYALLLLLHALTATAIAVSLRRGVTTEEAPFLFFRAPELLFALSAVVFLFSFIYATNANMDYVQRFMATHGNLRLAPNSSKERLSAYLRYLPLLAVDAAAVWYFRVRTSVARVEAWALPAAIVSGILYALSEPSFVRTGGIPVLAWVCLVPLLVVLEDVGLAQGIFYGTLAGIIQTMISNFWLGTFNLLTLQFVTVVLLLEYVSFMAISLALLRLTRNASRGWRSAVGWLVFPAAWTVFDWIRSQGFLGYPWGMLGASQYSLIPIIQVASMAGVWGVTFIVTMANGVIAWYAAGWIRGARRSVAPAVALGAVLAASLVWGGLQIRGEAAASQAGRRTVRVALVQQDADPRKEDYGQTFETLKGLTAEALVSKPDLVAWSETAFVPNIRRWSKEDPSKFPLAALVRDFLAYQRGIRTWLLTGNDDYQLRTVNGVEERLDYNGAVLFSPAGQRVETYHKIHLVPFTEYFPFKKQLPGLYQFLLSFDAYLWEPGDRRVVFHHPLFAFSTPICFEDSFPNDVRLFVTEGAQVILNLSNDYWSQTNAEAMQHAANAVFRAVENGRPLARASASGLTCVVDTLGRITARGPFYEPSFLVADLPVPNGGFTVYTMFGDWFPAAMALLLIGIAIASAVSARRRGRA